LEEGIGVVFEGPSKGIWIIRVELEGDEMVPKVNIEKASW
jgi:hypothetical protein